MEERRIEHNQIVPIEEWVPRHHYDAVKAIPWRYVLVLDNPALYACGIVIFPMKPPRWLYTRNRSSFLQLHKKADSFLRSHKGTLNNKTSGRKMWPAYIQYGNPDIAWLFCKAKSAYVPIQASYLNLILFMYEDAYFTYHGANQPIIIRSNLYIHRAVTKTSTVGLIREYKVDTTNLPFRVPIDLKWFN